MKFIALTSLLIISTASTIYAQIPFNDSQWEINAQYHVIENFKGLHSLYLKNGSAVLSDSKFESGIIEFDVYITRQVSFSGVSWRMNGSTYENFYIRAQRIGTPDSYQYNPVWNGNSSWQLMHDQFTGSNDGLVGWKPIEEGVGFNGILNLKYDQWTHVKLVVANDQAEVFFDFEEMPAAFIKKLNIPAAEGKIGLSSSAGGVHFANFKFTNNPNQQLRSSGTIEIEAPDGSITDWEISEPIDKNTLAGGILSDKFLKELKFSKVKSEESGLLNIGRMYPRDREKQSVLIRATIESDAKGLAKLSFGYSDEVSVYVDNQIVYQGTNLYRSRDFRYLGTIGFFDTVFVPVQRGSKEVYFLVSESFGGWGIKAKRDD